MITSQPNSTAWEGADMSYLLGGMTLNFFMLMVMVHVFERKCVSVPLTSI